VETTPPQGNHPVADRLFPQLDGVGAGEDEIFDILGDVKETVL
jgi:hypothetical protein